MATGSAGSKLWLVNIAEVGEPQPLDAARFEFLLSLLPQNERSAVTRFLQQKDRERALVSRIMQRKLVSDVIGVDFASAIIGRTLLGKPYIVDPHCAVPSRTYNYNVSHHGDFVVLAYHDACLIGVDLVDTHRPRVANQSFHEFLSCFRSQLTDRERASIASYPNAVAQYTHFYVHWALKEAFVKAVGQGIGYGLLSVELVVRYTKENFEEFDDFDDRSPQAKLDLQGRAELRQHGELRPDWKFDFWTFDGRHIIAVARGPIRDAIEDYRSKLGPNQAAAAEEEEAAAINEPLNALETLRIEDLLASQDRERWEAMR